tara:strand:+ start:4947 stop:5318 length:372 start_codon:yes stop_codon:yes gene_type:complete
MNNYFIAALAVSAISNVGLFFLVVAQSKKLVTISNNASDLIDIIDSYGNHLKAIYSMDAFYGDETLKGLLDHTKALRVLLQDQYGDILDLAEEIEYIELEEPDGEEEVTEKHVFYAGTRKSNN